MELLGQGFTWLDTGTHESLVDATNFVKTMETHQHRKIACLEEIAYLNGWISKDAVLEVYEVLKKNQYGQLPEGCRRRKVSGKPVLIKGLKNMRFMLA